MKNLGLYKDDLDIPRKQDVDAVASRVATNEDNIVMLDSDMETAQSDIATLKTNVTEVTNALTSKQDKIVGGASTITEDNLTANRVLVSNGSGKVGVSEVTSTELGYLDGVTSNVQTQLDSKLSEAPVTSVNGQTGAVTIDIPDSKSYYNKEYSGSLATSGWVQQSGSLYYKQITIAGMTSSQYPIVMPVWTNNRTNEQLAWNSLNAEVESFDGYVRFYAKTPITTAVSFVLLFGNV